ncbi:pescadillo homolog [Syzygium oleosum]|uniref:pescadillo homolog n=1 Tax=Syzygium oleosum TaxID=219896 RepID=UPI0024BA3769|nr:pescadillo homolog [Syzygium oleosum]
MVVSKVKMTSNSVDYNFFVRCALVEEENQMVPPPYLSPLIDNEAEGYVPDYVESIKHLQAAARNEVLLMPGTVNEDLEDPQRLLVEGIIDCAEANEADEKKRKEYNLLMADRDFLV